MYSFSFSFVFLRLGLFTRYYIYYCIHSGSKNNQNKELLNNKNNNNEYTATIDCLNLFCCCRVNACDVLILFNCSDLQRILSLLHRLGKESESIHANMRMRAFALALSLDSHQQQQQQQQRHKQKKRKKHLDVMNLYTLFAWYEDACNMRQPRCAYIQPYHTTVAAHT